MVTLRDKKDIENYDEKSKTILQLSLNGDLIKEWVNASVASIECGLGYKAINQCARGKTKTSGGFVWKYKD